MTTNLIPSTTANDANLLSADELDAVSGGLIIRIFGLEIEFEKDAVTVCGPDKCVRVTSKSVVTF
jgi:hypothetical protein